MNRLWLPTMCPVPVQNYETDVMKLDDLQQAFERLTSSTDPVVKIVVKP